MDVIAAFNSYNLKTIIRVKDMVANKAYPIDGAYRSTTKYGETVVLHLEDGVFYLPKRFNSMSNELLEKITEGAFSISKVVLHEEMNDPAYKLELSVLFNPTTNTFFSSY